MEMFSLITGFLFRPLILRIGSDVTLPNSPHGISFTNVSNCFWCSGRTSTTKRLFDSELYPEFCEKIPLVFTFSMDIIAIMIETKKHVYLNGKYLQDAKVTLS